MALFHSQMQRHVIILFLGNLRACCLYFFRFREPTEPEPTEIDIDIVGSGEIPDEVVGVGKSMYYGKC